MHHPVGIKERVVANTCIRPSDVPDHLASVIDAAGGTVVFARRPQVLHGSVAAVKKGAVAAVAEAANDLSAVVDIIGCSEEPQVSHRPATVKKVRGGSMLVNHHITDAYDLPYVVNRVGLIPVPS